MKYVPFEEIGREAWDDFCSSSESAWFRHTSAWIEYTQHMRSDGNSLNCSFAVADSGKLLAVVPLIKETIPQRNELFEFGFAGWNVPYPAFANNIGESHKHRIEKEIFSEIDRLAHIHNIAYASFEVSPFNLIAAGHRFPVNPLPTFGFTATDMATHIVELDPDESHLRRAMRKGHKSDIVAAEKNGFTARVYDSASITPDVFAIYRNIHFHAAGRQTRSEKTWEFMHEWIQAGSAVLGILHHGSGAAAAAALTIKCKSAAYYGSSCVEPEYANERGGMHLLLWETMRHLKQKGMRWFETGWQFTPTLSQEIATPKEVNIALFKRGFGGMDVCYYRGEKFYDYEFMKGTFTNRLEKFNMTWMRPTNEGITGF